MRGDRYVEMFGVELRYASQPPVIALAGIDLTVEQGEMVTIMGPSGSGKSSLLNLLGGLTRPTAGHLNIAGWKDPSPAQFTALRRREIGFVFQSYHLLPYATAVENVMRGQLYSWIPWRERERRAAATLTRVGLGDRLYHKSSELSGGEQQRVALARALVKQPALLLCDEPTGNLDTDTGRRILDLIQQANAAGATIVIVTHDHYVAEVAPRTVMLRDGVIEGEGR